MQPDFFGQTAESDRVKRAREDVTLSELELQVAEKARALKRRKIESIPFCLEALECIGGADQRDKLRATDMIRTVAFSSSSTDPVPTGKEVCIREVINAAGRAEENGLDGKVGKLAETNSFGGIPGICFSQKINLL